MQDPHQQTDSDSSESDRTRALHALRTIVTMLSLIQSERKDEKQDVLSSEMKKELQILDAFAAVAVRKNDVVAVAANPDGSGNFEVIASVHFIRPRERLTAPQQSPVANLRRLLSLYMARNPRKPALETAKQSSTNSAASPNPVPNLVDPELSVPQFLKDSLSGEHLLEVFLTRVW